MKEAERQRFSCCERSRYLLTVHNDTAQSMLLFSFLLLFPFLSSAAFLVFVNINSRHNALLVGLQRHTKIYFILHSKSQASLGGHVCVHIQILHKKNCVWHQQQNNKCVQMLVVQLNVCWNCVWLYFCKFLWKRKVCTTLTGVPCQLI